MKSFSVLPPSPLMTKDLIQSAYHFHTSCNVHQYHDLVSLPGVPINLLICWLLSYSAMCKYFNQQENVQTFHSPGKCVNISFCRKMCKYFTHQENMQIFQSAGKCANISLCIKMCKYFNQRENVQIFHSPGNCANISISRKMWKYFNPQVWFSCDVSICTENVLCSLKSDLLRVQPRWLALYQGRTENGGLFLVFYIITTHFRPCSRHHWSGC